MSEKAIFKIRGFVLLLFFTAKLVQSIPITALEG
jgi:hypothetical protein